MKKKKIYQPSQPIEVEVGAVVFLKGLEETKFALILDRFGFWTFPKGKIDPGESAEESAVREVREELGIGHLLIHGNLGEVEYPVHWGLRRRQVAYFLCSTMDVNLKIGPSESHRKAKWFRSAEVRELNCYKETKTVLERALRTLSKQGVVP